MGKTTIGAISVAIQHSCTIHPHGQRCQMLGAQSSQGEDRRLERSTDISKTE